jgi:hypothetical protein
MDNNITASPSKIKLLTEDQPEPVAKILLVGPSGVGKTYSVRTLDYDSTLYIDVAGGSLSIADVPIPTIRVRDWSSLRDVACWLGGPDPSYPNTSPYSTAHYINVCAQFPNPGGIKTVVLDDASEATRLALRFAMQQPEATTKSGARDLLSVYGIVGRESIGLFQHIQHTPRNMVLIGILETIRDEFNRPIFEIQLEGSKAGRELPGIVDEVITLAHVDLGDKRPFRAFVCASPNQWNFPAKDRSGKLDQLEPPDLGQLIAKITGR